MMNDKHGAKMSNETTVSETTAKIPKIEDFAFIKPISRGAFGKVFLGYKRGRPDHLYAIKAMKKADMVNKNLVHQVIAERDAMAKSSSPFVVQLFYSMQSKQNIFLVMEYLIGGDVKSLLAICGYFDEDMALMYVAEVTLALEYLHSKGTIHRDLKPDNMLITAEGHIKLTDFGLSKVNMNFKLQNMFHTELREIADGYLPSLTGGPGGGGADSAEVPMTPKTPMSYSYRSFDSYRTPGQILSLNSSLLFSSKKTEHGPAGSRTPEMSGKSSRALAGIPEKQSPYSVKSAKAKSLREQLLSQSMVKSIEKPEDSVTTGNAGTPRPPIQGLESTFLALKNQPASFDDSRENMTSIDSGSDASDAYPRPYLSSERVTGSRMVSIETVSESELSDSVFSHGSGEDASHITGQYTDENRAIDTSSSCHKAPSADTDGTPQLYKTEEAVWNSYAAKNLRSMRHGSYSEDSEEGDHGSHQESISETYDSSPEKAVSKDFHIRCEIRNKKKAIFPRSKSFNYPSEDEDDEDRGLFRRASHRVRFARKRSFEDVDTSPVRRTHSMESGLTHDIRLVSLCEPWAKRSNSVPRTRIDFKAEHWSDSDCSRSSHARHSSHETAGQTKSKNKDCDIEKKNCKSVDKGESVCGRLEDQSAVTCKQERKLQRSSRVAEEDVGKENIFPVEGLDPIVGGPGQFFKDKRFSHLHRAVVSSIGSRGSGHFSVQSDLSSICDTDADPFSPTATQSEPVVMENVNPPQKSQCSESQDLFENSSVFQNMSPQKHESPRRPPSTPVAAASSHKALATVPSSPGSERLLPPPPPKTKERRPSGKSSPPRLRFNSMTSNIPPYVYSDCSGASSRSEAPMTPEAATRTKVVFHTPKPYSQTPRTPYQKNMGMRSLSASVATRTPYRTPKSIRRGGFPPPEEERILGTPDYLAPEIIQQRPHGPAVDWWALGICMFEFLTGVPPFNDLTHEKVFDNILKRDIPWPEGEEALSEDIQQAIDSLLTMDPASRPQARQVRKMAAFNTVDWNNLLEVTPPFIPQPDDNMDTSYFDARNSVQDLFVSDIDF